MAGDGFRHIEGAVSAGHRRDGAATLPRAPALFRDPAGRRCAYGRLQQYLEHDAGFPTNIVYYMAVRPADYPHIVEKLGGVGLLSRKAAGVAW